MVEAGQFIAGRYRLTSPIGEGAMASVWRAEDQTLQRVVAIKFLYVKGARDPKEMIDQFLREARIAASVQHRNVIHTVDFGSVDDDQPFMVMEMLTGESLADRMKRSPPLERAQFMHLVSLTLRGLSAVHDAGIVHRDLKPANIFLQRDTDTVYPKILDFGISKSLRQGQNRPSAIATQDGLIVGTPDYMPPEQARGEADVDRRADIYSMGAILYEGLTGQLPFHAETIGDLIVKIVSQSPPTVKTLCPDLPSAISAVVEQAMSRDRENRFADARAMRRALLSASEQPVPARRDVRSGASLPTALQAPSAPAGAPRAAEPAAAASPGSAAPNAWGDFDPPGGVLDPGPASPPARPPGPVPVPQAAAAAPAPARAETPQKPPEARPASPVLREEPSRRAAATPQGAPQGLQRNEGPSSETLDPLYRGKSLPALELDLDRIDRKDRPKEHPKPAEPPREARANGRGAGQVKGPVQPKRAAAAPHQRPRGRRGGQDPQPRQPSAGARPKPPSEGRSAPLWLLAVAALLFGVYLLVRPGRAVLPAEPSVRGLETRELVKTRRTNLKNVPAHLRDVRF